MYTALEERVDEDFEPTQQEIEAYADWMGMDLEVDRDILWIVREALKAPLAKPWKPYDLGDGQIFYFNWETGESVWEHPNDTRCKKMYEERRRVGKSSISDMHQVVAKLRDELQPLYQRSVFLGYCLKPFSEELRQLHMELDFVFDRIEVLEAEKSALCSTIDEPDAWERPASKVGAEVVTETPKQDDATSVLDNSNTDDVRHALEKKRAELEELESRASVVKAAIQEHTEEALLASASLLAEEALSWVPCCSSSFPSGLKLPECKLKLARMLEDREDACKRQPGGSCHSCFRKTVATKLAEAECSSKPDGSKLSDLSQLKKDISERMKHATEDNRRFEQIFMSQLEHQPEVLDTVRAHLEEKREVVRALEAEIKVLSQRHAGSSPANATDGEAQKQATEANRSTASNSALPANAHNPDVTKSPGAALGEDPITTVNIPTQDRAATSENKACTATDTTVISVLRLGGDSFEVKVPPDSTVAELRDRIATAWELRPSEIKLIADEVVPQLHQTVASLTGPFVACACMAPEDTLRSAANHVCRLQGELNRIAARISELSKELHTRAS